MYDLGPNYAQGLVNDTIFNWYDLISITLIHTLKKAKDSYNNETTCFYMVSYLMDCVCACINISGFEVLWQPTFNPWHVHYFFSFGKNRNSISIGNKITFVWFSESSGDSLL